MATVTRTIKFRVFFPSLRSADLKGKDGLAYTLAVVQGEMTRSANLAMTALWAAKNKALPTPASLQTLTYQALSGKWEPIAGKTIAPKLVNGRKIGSNVLLATASLLDTRLKQDAKKIAKGEGTLSTFKDLPIYVAGAGIAIDPNTDRFRLTLWGGRENNYITLAPMHMRGGQREIYNRIKNGTYKHGDAKLFRDRKGKWTVAMSWSGAIEDKPAGLVCGIDLGIAVAATLGYTDATGAAQWARDAIRIPKSTARAWFRTDTERKERMETCGEAYDARSGRGRDRKLRPIEVLTGKRDRMVDSTVKETAAAIVRTAIKRGASTLVLEDLSKIVTNKLDQTEDLEGKNKTFARRNFLAWQQGALREQIKNAAPLSGLKVVVIDPAYTSKTCHHCGVVWTDTPAKNVATTLGIKSVVTKKPTASLGRYEQAHFRCDCPAYGTGRAMNADLNAAINIARLGAVDVARKAALAANPPPELVVVELPLAA